jgi:hypothetical protein
VNETSVESAARDLARRWGQPSEQRRLDLLREFARGAGFELYFDAHGQAVLHTGFYLQGDGDVARIAAPCVDRAP